MLWFLVEILYSHLKGLLPVKGPLLICIKMFETERIF